VEVFLVLIGAAAGLAGSIVIETFRTRREHRRWLLERRYDVYVRALSHVDELLTWARNEATAPMDSEGPASQEFPALNASMNLVASDRVLAVWGELDAVIRRFYPAHIAAVHATRAAHDAGHADSDTALRGRLELDKIVTEARQLEKSLAKEMERDTGRRRDREVTP
jgi:hypothetical protein